MNLFYRQYGSGEPLLILHGLFGQCDNWAGIAKALSEKYTVYCMDLPNHGQSAHTEEFNYPAMLEDVRMTIENLSIKSFHLLGHSMGGKVAMYFAQAYPELLKSLLVIDIGPKYYKPHHQEIISGLQAVNLRQLTSRNQAEQQLMPYIEEAATRQFLLKNLVRKEDNSFEWRFNLDLIAENIEEIGAALPEGKIMTETLFYRGGNSRYIKDEDVATIKLQFPNATFETMQGAGHWLHAEKPGEFVGVVADFLGAT